MRDDLFDGRTCCDGLCHQGRNCPLRPVPPSDGYGWRLVGLALLALSAAVVVGLLWWWLW